jgi:hypothetical protein
MTDITSVYVRLYVNESHTKFHKDWCSFEEVMAVKLNLYIKKKLYALPGIESPKLPLNTENVTAITDEMAVYSQNGTLPMYLHNKKYPGIQTSQYIRTTKLYMYNHNPAVSCAQVKPVHASYTGIVVARPAESRQSQRKICLFLFTSYFVLK